MMRPLRTLIRARTGAAALETAIILPIVAGIVMATLDFSNGWLTKLRLEQAALKMAARARERLEK